MEARLATLRNVQLADVKAKAEGVLVLQLLANMEKLDGSLSAEIGVEKLFTIKGYDRANKQWVDNQTDEEKESYKAYVLDKIGIDWDTLESYVVSPIEEPIALDETKEFYINTDENTIHFTYFEPIPKADKLTDEDLLDKKCNIIITRLIFSDKTGFQIFGKPDMDNKKTASNFGAYKDSTFVVRIKYHKVLEQMINGEKKLKNILDLGKMEKADKKFVGLLDTDEIDTNNLHEKMDEITENIKGKKAVFAVKKAGSNLYFEADTIEYEEE